MLIKKKPSHSHHSHTMLGASAAREEEMMEDFEELWQALDEAAEQHEAERKKAEKEAKI